MRDKIMDRRRARQLCERARSESRTVVFTNGCFDLLHAGHVDYLEAARALGDLLIVGLNSDASVRRIKGEKRPLNVYEDRAAVLAGLWAVDAVVGFDEDDPLEIISYLVPHVLAKGADWEEDRIVGADVVKSAGGRVERIELTAGRSTTSVVERIVRRYGGQ